MRLALRLRVDHIEVTGIADKLARHAVDGSDQIPAARAEGAVAMLALAASDARIAADGERLIDRWRSEKDIGRTIWVLICSGDDRSIDRRPVPD